SGAFLLLPFQLSVLDFTAPGVTPTNLLYNVISTPGGITRYKLDGALDWSLIRTIATGAVPGVIVGSILRITVFEDPGDFKVLVGIVLLGLGANLVVQSLRPGSTPGTATTFAAPRVVVLALGAGTIGGIYGVSGGSIIAPVLAGMFGLPVRRVAPAALVATLITSIAGVISFEVLALTGASGPDSRPDWLLALLFGVGGAAGGFTGARLNKLLPERPLRALLGVLGLTLALTYIAPVL
ncbi:MAG TPA: sulfite exporter TauE/SafE family protein, partial [Actinomycetota bacterium]